MKRRLAGMLLSGFLVIAAIYFGIIGSGSSIKVNADSTVERQMIEFGSYWQEEYTPVISVDNPENDIVYTDSDGTKMIYVSDTGKFYRKSPIKWRVLKRNGSDYLLISDRVIDNRQFHNQNTATKWENSEIRSWLNNDFYEEAFSGAEQNAIRTTNLNQSVADYVYLMSYKSVLKASYSFSSLPYASESRVAKATEFAKAIHLDFYMHILT